MLLVGLLHAIISFCFSIKYYPVQELQSIVGNYSTDLRWNLVSIVYSDLKNGSLIHLN